MDKHNSDNSNVNNEDGDDDDDDVSKEEYNSCESYKSNNNDVDYLHNRHSKKEKICLCCLNEVEGSSRCSKCRTALYCSRECQVKHWPAHKSNCHDSNNADSDVKLNLKALNHVKQGNVFI